MRHSKRLTFLADAFASDVKDCILWPFAVRKSSGYGAFDIKVSGKSTSVDVHRYVCEIANGATTPGMQAAHECGVKLCVNPKHLYWATPKENMEDAKAHGTLRGGGRYRQKISKAEAISIVRSTESHLALARKYGVDPSYIGRLRRTTRAELSHGVPR
jgi:hypothetical protein